MSMGENARRKKFERLLLAPITFDGTKTHKKATMHAPFSYI